MKGRGPFSKYNFPHCDSGGQKSSFSFFREKGCKYTNRINGPDATALRGKDFFVVKSQFLYSLTGRGLGAKFLLLRDKRRLINPPFNLGARKEEKFAYSGQGPLGRKHYFLLGADGHAYKRAEPPFYAQQNGRQWARRDKTRV